MVAAMIALASNLGMTPLAEGSRPRRSGGSWPSAGARSARASYFSRPVPARRHPGDASPLGAPRGRRAAPATAERALLRASGSEPLRRPRAEPLKTVRGGATFMPSCSNSSCRSRRAAMRHTSPCCSGVTNVMLVPAATRARRAPDPVDVRLVVLRRVVVDDQRDVVQVEPPRGDVGRHEHTDVPVREPLERALARLLPSCRRASPAPGPPAPSAVARGSRPLASC